MGFVAAMALSSFILSTHTATSTEWMKSNMRTTETEADAAMEMVEKVKLKLEKDYHHCKEIRNVDKPDELKKAIESYMEEISMICKEPPDFDSLPDTVGSMIDKSKKLEEGLQSMATVIACIVDLHAYLKVGLFCKDTNESEGLTKSLMMLIGKVI